MNRRVIAGGIALVAVAAAVLAVSGAFSAEDGDPEADSAFGSAGASEPGPSPTAPRVRRYDVGGRPDSIGAGAGYAWAADSIGGTLDRINPGSKQPIAVEVAGFPTDVSAGEGAAWLAHADSGAVQRATGTEGAGGPIRVDGFPFRVAAGEGSVWAMSLRSIEPIDPEAEEAGETLDLEGEFDSIAAGEGGVWVVRGMREVLKLDPGSGRETASAEVPGAFTVTTGESAAWALSGSAGPGSGEALTRLDPSGYVTGEPVPVVRAVDVAAGLGFVWVLGADGRLTRYDPETGLPAGDPIPVGKQPASVSVGEGAAWVAATGEGAVYRVTP